MLLERLNANLASSLALSRLLLLIVALRGLRPGLGILARCNGSISGIDCLSQGQFFVDFFDAFGIGLILIHEVAEAEPAHGLVLRSLIPLENAGGLCGHRLET